MTGLLLTAVGLTDPQKDQDVPEPTAQRPEQNGDNGSVEDKPDPGSRVQTAETFTPSEEISEDLSVSYPVDI